VAPGAQRILKRRGRLVLVETTNPPIGVGYAVRNGNLGPWNGDSLAQAEQEFEKALAA
jgi:ubiquinone/menaquinone biosynthesis C-methylase UbiE